jgi:hypothetical protein
MQTGSTATAGLPALLASDRSPFPASLAAAFRQTLRLHRPLIVISIVYVACAWTAALLWSKDAANEVLTSFPATLIGTTIVICSVAGLSALVFLVRRRPAHPFSAIWQAIAAPGAAALMVSRAVVIVPLMILVVLSFAEIKSRIPDFLPFTFDPAFVAIDRWLHFGVEPWIIIQPVVGYPAITDFIDRLYYLWFPIIFVTFYWQVFATKHPVLRLQFILSYALCWMLIGTAGAIAFSSAGPVFLANLGLDDSAFTGLFAYLHGLEAQGHSINALTVQDMLWKTYATGESFPFEGISAMPSMHVAVSLLLAIFGWRRHWLLGVGFSAFALVIFLGSIHLGFHYAIDGYVAALMVAAIWWITGRVARRTISEVSASP